MIVASEQWDWGALTPELRGQLADLLPLEIRDQLFSTDTPPLHSLHAIHTRLGQLWGSISAMAPRWIVDGVDDPAWRCVCNADATLLFADVTGFTPLTAQLEMFGRIGNEYMTAVLNRFFATVVPIALAHGGDLLSFGGDAILVSFDGPSHALLAVAAAWEMQQALDLLDLHDLGLPNPPRLQMKIGLASGPLVLASLGTDTRRVALPMGSVLDTTDVMANATLPGGIRLDTRTTMHAAPIAHLALQPDGSALLLGLHERPLPPARGDPETASAGIGELAGRIVALARYLPRSIVESLVATPHAAPGYGEQRFVVSLFSHLSGLHALADAFWSIEPGLVARAADLALNRAMALIEGYGGVLGRIDIYGGGHKLLALFGAPVAHEQEAARAVLVALALREAMPRINAEIGALLAGWRIGAPGAAFAAPELALRSGINAGPVVAGMVGSPLRWEYTVMGDAVNVGARLMGKAQPGEVLASPSVRAMTGDVLEAHSRVLILKGKREPVRVWSVRALQLTNHSSPLQDMQLIGREPERSVLRTLGESLRAGRAAVAFVQGEAGIGKSRLARELPAILGDGVLCIQSGSPGMVPVSFGIFRLLLLELCRGLLGLPTLPDSEQLRVALAELCPQQSAEFWPAIAVLLGLSDGESAGFGASAEAQQRLLAEAVRDVLACAAARQPLAWICEDLHEADDASLAVLEQLLAIGWNAPVLLCATLRSSTATSGLARRLVELADQQFQGAVASLELRGLSHDAGDALLESLLPGLAPATRAALHAHTTGNPLFLQVLAETVRQERMLTPSSQGFTLSRPLMALDVPRTVRELVAAQVDRLPAEVRRLAQIAAVIAVADRTVPLWLLERMVDEPQAVLPRLRALALAHVIEAEAAESGPRYSFRHALYQQAAYDQLLERERQELHRRAGLALHENQNRQAAWVEALAYHCYEGQCWELALEYSLAAGQRALQSYANREARRLLRRSLGLARRLGLAREEAEAREGLGELYSLIGRFQPARAHLERTLRCASPYEADVAELETRARRHRLLAEIAEAVGEYDRGEEEARSGLALAEQLREDVRERLRLHEQLAIILMRRGNLDGAEEICRAGLAILSPDSPVLRERVALLQLVGSLDLQRGNHQVAVEAIEQCLVLARQINDVSLTSPILRNLGLGQYLIGQRVQAQICYEESIDIDERIGNVGGVIISNNNLGLVYILNGDYEHALACFQKALRLAQAHNMIQRLANVTTNLGMLYFVTGDLDQAEVTLLQSYDLFSEFGEALSLADCLYQMGDVALARGQMDSALSYGEQTLMYARQVGSIMHESYGLRVIGETMLALDRLAEAADVLHRAQELQSRVDDPLGEVLLLRAAALLAWAQADYEAAARLARTGLTLAQAQNVPHLIARMSELVDESEVIQTEVM